MYDFDGQCFQIDFCLYALSEINGSAPSLHCIITFLNRGPKFICRYMHRLKSVGTALHQSLAFLENDVFD